MVSLRYDGSELESFINLVSDDESSVMGDPDIRAPPPQRERFIGVEGAETVNGHFRNHGARPLNSTNSPIDLTGPDIPGNDLASASEPAEIPMGVVVEQDLASGELMSEAACLEMCLDVLPGISIDHVLELLRTNTDDSTRTPAACERIITQLVDSGEYPKEQDLQNSRKRKRPDEEELIQFERGVQSEKSTSYDRDAQALLCDVFTEVPQKHITSVLRTHRTLFKAYGVIDDELRHYNDPEHRANFVKCIRKRNDRGTEALLIARGSAIPKELHVAKQKSAAESAKRLRAEEEREAEEINLQQARATGEITECECCFDEFPTNRVTGCTGSHVHYFCKPCAKTYVETELGSGRCRPVCFADSDCGGKFLRRELQDFLGETSFERLEHMQQQEDLAAAGLEFLSECPFCDYKAECLPVEIDREFRCMNPKCEKISCRLCNRETHVPLSCEEAKKDESVNMRHIVEEAMSAALIRHCNKCKHAFVKELGCNKMTCSHCRNIQCYVCSKNVSSYEHFKDGRGDARGGKCPLHDNVEARHEAEVKKAAEEALAKVQSERPDLSPADLTIQVSESVKRAEEARRDRARTLYRAGDAPLGHNGPPLEALRNPQLEALRNIQLAQQQARRAHEELAAQAVEARRIHDEAWRVHELAARGVGQQLPVVHHPEPYIFQPPNPFYQQHAPPDLPDPPGPRQGYLAAPAMAAGWPGMAAPNIQPPHQPVLGPPNLLFFPIYPPEPPNQPQ